MYVYSSACEVGVAGRATTWRLLDSATDLGAKSMVWCSCTLLFLLVVEMLEPGDSYICMRCVSAVCSGKPSSSKRIKVSAD